MKKFFVLSMLIGCMQILHAQVPWIPIASFTKPNGIWVQDYFALPNDTISNAPTGSLAILYDTLYEKTPTYWKKAVGSVSSNVGVVSTLSQLPISAGLVGKSAAI